MTAMPRHRAVRVRVPPARRRGGAPSGVHPLGCVIARIMGFVQALCRTRLGEHGSPNVPWRSARSRVRIAENLYKLMDMPRVTRRPSEPEGGEEKPMQASRGQVITCTT